VSRIKAIFHHLRKRPRLLTATVVGGALFLLSSALLPEAKFPRSTRALLAWDIGTLLYLVLAWVMMVRASVESVRSRARVQDDGAVAVLVATVIASGTSLATILLELARSKSSVVQDQAWHLGLAAFTIVCSWLFMHTAFAIHYAHHYYRRVSRGGEPSLEFPHQPEPSYWDFLYFSFTVGTTAQTSDVQVTTSDMRKLVLLHAVVAFFFNTTVLALTVNIAAGF
jgi:uncharacterized membrane protein